MTQKSVLITGCSSGIGYDAAHALKARGWRVFASCRKQEDCDRLIAEGLESPRIDYDDEASIDDLECAIGDQTAAVAWIEAPFMKFPFAIEEGIARMQ